MMNFSFDVDAGGQVFCESIVRTMVDLFKIDEEEALGRLNRAWKGKPVLGKRNLVYHRLPGYWANTIYYGDDSRWSENPPGLRPLPYP